MLRLWRCVYYLLLAVNNESISSLQTNRTCHMSQNLVRIFTSLSFLVLLYLPLPLTAQVSINFRDAEISSLIESVAEITGRSFVLDPRVSGRVTIIAPQAIDADMLYEAFLAAIQVQGFQGIEDGPVTRIVPLTQAFGMLAGGANELETRLFRVETVDATELVTALRPLLSAAARIQAFAQRNYIIVTDTSANVAALAPIIAELDDPANSEIEIINLEHIAAAEAVHIVSQLQQLRDQGLSVVEDSRYNRLIVSGPRLTRTIFRNMVSSLDVVSTRNAGTEVIFLNFSKASQLKPVLDGLLASDSFLQMAGQIQQSDTGDLRSQAYRVEIDETNNALIVAAPPAVLLELRNIVRQLDLSRPQVLIEAVVAELSEDQARRLSVQLAYADRNSGGYLSKFDNILSTLLGAAGDGEVTDQELQVMGNLLGGVSGGLMAGGDFDSASGRGFGLLVQALKSDGRTRVLSTPSIVTLDNEIAKLSVGENVPFLTGSFTSAAADGTNPFQTIVREDVGIKLTVLPQISQGTSVRLTLEQESSKLLGSGAQLGTADVVTSKSTISTNVIVQDGDLLILGGLIDGQSSQAQTRVPLLGDIPLLGTLFRSSARSSGERVLMIFIRPTILRDAGTALSVSEQRFNHLITTELGQDDAFNQRLQDFLLQEE